MYFVDSHDTSRRKLAEVSGTNCTSNDAVMTKVDNTDDDDRPLSAWFGMQSPPNVNEPSKLVLRINSLPVIAICSDYICFLLRTIVCWNC